MEEKIVSGGKVSLKELFLDDVSWFLMWCVGGFIFNDEMVFVRAAEIRNENCLERMFCLERVCVCNNLSRGACLVAKMKL